jgi:excisionase family DNA binding protein
MARMPEPSDPRLFTAERCLLVADDVARMLGVPKTWVYAETRAGRLPHVKVGRYRRYRREAVEAWITEHEGGPTPSRRNGAAPDERGRAA